MDSKREEKRKSTRKSLSLEAAFDDTLSGYKTPESARKLSKEFADESAELEGRIRNFSSSSADETIGATPEKSHTYINQRLEFLDDIDKLHKKVQRTIKESIVSAPRGPERNELKRTLADINEADINILRERSKLAGDAKRIKARIFSVPSGTRLAEAYMMAITDQLPEPAEASYKSQHSKRSGTDQTAFRNRLIKAYNTNGDDILKTDPAFLAEIWCPISGKKHNRESMKAAHIVPYSMDETHAAYLFGCKFSDGYDVIWGTQNGMMLHATLEKLLDDGRMVIIPDPADQNEFLSIILSQALLKSEHHCAATNAPYRLLHKKRLQFETSARPAKRFLYVHTLLTMFRRQRYCVPGWETDRTHIIGGQIWASPGKWARRSLIEALAIEYGDTWGEIKTLEGLEDFPDAKSLEEEKTISILVRSGVELKTDEDGEE